MEITAVVMKIIIGDQFWTEVCINIVISIGYIRG